MIQSESVDAVNAGLPLVSIIIPAYNRAHTIERTVDSVLKQSYRNIEMIVVDDGSTDNTLDVLKKYSGSALRIYQHGKNRGATAAKNSGLDHIRGEWFTILDSDDEIEPLAIETMMRIPLSVDANVTAVTCNCLDTTTREFSGKGLQENQYLDVATMMTACRGEFWGITKTSLLGNDRFNEKVGLESILWYKINDRANRYYVHAPLRIYHTEGTDRVMKAKYSFKKEVAFYENLALEDGFLNTTKTYRPGEFFLMCRNAVVVMMASNKKDLAKKYYELSKEIGRSSVVDLSYKYRLFSVTLKNYKLLKSFARSRLLRKK